MACALINHTGGVAEDSENVVQGMEHVLTRHMFPARHGKSYFISNDAKEVCHMVMEAIRRPDRAFPHSFKVGRKVLKKLFERQIGVKGVSQEKCYCVTVILDDASNALITAFPTVK